MSRLESKFFLKKFSIGLTLDTSLEEFKTFLIEYHMYISNFYFSLPMGDKFHARENIKVQMKNQSIVNMFWKMLEIIKEFDIKLELVLNNGNVTYNDILHSKKILFDHGIEIDILGITDDIYDFVKEIYPNKEIVYSFKNNATKLSDYKNIKNVYQQIVVGRQNIRDTKLFSYIKNELCTEVVLLLNNGCSHICGGCSTLINCHLSYYKLFYRYSPEYIYALQSIMPFEIHEKYINLKDVKLLKISSRNASLEYLKNCLKSYIHCIENEYIKNSKLNYLLWSRLAWHVDYFSLFDINMIKNYKKSIYNNAMVSLENKFIKVSLDLRNKTIEDYKIYLIKLNQISIKLPYLIDECVLGFSNVNTLLTNIIKNTLDKFIEKLMEDNIKIFFDFPPLFFESCKKNRKIIDFINSHKTEIKCCIINDLNDLLYIKKYCELEMCFGNNITNGKLNVVDNSYLDDNYTLDLISIKLRKMCNYYKVGTIFLKLDKGGIHVPINEKIKIKGFINLNDKITPNMVKTIIENRIVPVISFYDA